MRTPENKPNILAISGSLRINSSNNSVIHTIVNILGGRANLIIYSGLATIPPFDDSRQPAESVLDFRRQLSDADGVFICSPEYAFGVPGVLKNAVDWTVSSGEFVNKPVALITAATGGDKAHGALLLTLTALSAKVGEGCALLISYIRSKMSESGEITDPVTINAISSVADALLAAIELKYNQGV